jgi:hypothetical protein
MIYGFGYGALLALHRHIGVAWQFLGMTEGFVKLLRTCAGMLAFIVLGLSAPAGAKPPKHINPPGPAGGNGTNLHNPPGPAGGPGTSVHYRGWHYQAWNGRNYYWNANKSCWFLPDHDDNPPGPAGGPGTNWENPPGPKGGDGESPDKSLCH